MYVYTYMDVIYLGMQATMDENRGQWLRRVRKASEGNQYQ